MSSNTDKITNFNKHKKVLTITSNKRPTIFSSNVSDNRRNTTAKIPIFKEMDVRRPWETIRTSKRPQSSSLENLFVVKQKELGKKLRNLRITTCEIQEKAEFISVDSDEYIKT